MSRSSSWGTPLIVVVFVAAGIATWIAGLYLPKVTDVLDKRFELGDAVGGMLLLGLAGSLPELAIVSSAALSGHLALARGNLTGGIAIQTLVLVFLDATSRRRRPLTSLVSDTNPLIECMLVSVLVTIARHGRLHGRDRRTSSSECRRRWWWEPSSPPRPSRSWPACCSSRPATSLRTTWG